jgi:hypothetical protein
MPCKFKKKKGYQQGGPMRGPSHARGGIPIEVEGGEYMIKKESVNPQTEKTLEHINKTGTLPQYDAGGRVQRSNEMPKVGEKEFPYTPQGYAAAEQESSATGIPMEDAANRTQMMYPGGGKTGYNVPMYKDGGNTEKEKKRAAEYSSKIAAEEKIILEKLKKKGLDPESIKRLDEKIEGEGKTIYGKATKEKGELPLGMKQAKISKEFYRRAKEFIEKSEEKKKQGTRLYKSRKKKKR